MKILYDDSKHRTIDAKLEELNQSIVKTMNYANGISVPSGFDRKNDVFSTRENIRNSKELIVKTRNWIKKVNNDFTSTTNESKSRIIKIENKRIVKKDILVK